MAEQTNIEWADSTLNIWMGCQETGSPACVGCYARQLVEERFGLTTWGPHGKRIETKSWRSNLRKISRLAKAAGRPWFVFVNSLSDFWDNQADPKLRAEALAEFAKHPHLTFLLLTKRPQMIIKLVYEALALQGKAGDLSLHWPRNIAIGCTVVTQAEADRDIPHLLAAKATLQPAFAFLSMEPLVEIVDLTRIKRMAPGVLPFDALRPTGRQGDYHGLDWVITGGATDQGKHKAYPTPFAAFRKVRDDCAAAGVAYLHKQNGEFVEFDLMEIPSNGTGPAEVFSTVQRFGNTKRITGEVRRVGKKAAGRMLDGRTHDERPKVTA
jgi:protein gp37